MPFNGRRFILDTQVLDAREHRPALIDASVLACDVPKVCPAGVGVITTGVDEARIRRPAATSARLR